ncbi:MAG: hypothetical protein ABI625_11410 [bacterium]
MERYVNANGGSGVTHYEIGADYIDITFANEGTYRYDYSMPGQIHVYRMKQLAKAGRGLSTYISQVVRNQYALKK